ncbi:predicted protein [Naegleria gruberi]|uniref:Predicted protein n=1 Tax=Naegleria gruberi TaxID=5762 RepID=D2W514_NAEGR|nr:uncharacterized protein NAEGRDRAFT_76502 [Naegleria gruberi]EFC35842.1 predicted protein [Naegleria gruberi]|eukprot:XP_002668586.1 predicted protein [Naegleria gruberi strain NEG-M]
MDHFNVAASRNYKKAILEQALLLRSGSPDGVIPKNPFKSLELFKQVRFNSIAHKNLIEMFRNGEGLAKASYIRVVFQIFRYLMVRIAKRTVGGFAYVFLEITWYILAFSMASLVLGLVLEWYLNR